MIDEFTVSYHTEATDRQKQQFRNNLITIRDSGSRQKCIVLMHGQPDLFEDANRMIAWLQEQNINFMPKQLDGVDDYNKKQIIWFDQLNQSKTFGTAINQQTSRRSCCGGRQLCADQNYKERHHYTTNQFSDWYCSVNHFFLYVKQVTGEIFVNKDCKMNYEGRVGPIGYLGDTKLMLSKLKMQIDTGTLPVIQCKKSKCFCGLCAPKAKDLETYHNIMKKYQKGITQ